MRAIATGAALGLAALPAPAAAQTATAIERFEPAPAGDALFTVPDARVDGHLRASGSALFSYERAPLVLTARSASGERTVIQSVIRDRVMGHGLLSVDLWRRLKLEFDVPFSLSQRGDTLEGGFPVPEGAALHDLRVGARLELLRQQGFVPSAAVAASLWIPSGDDSAYAGTGRVRFAPSILLGADYGPIVWGASFGRRFQQAVAGESLLGGELLFNAGIAGRIAGFQIGPELYGSTVADVGVNAFARSTTSLEALLGVRYKLGPVTLGVAGGPGLGRGVGTPQFRVIGGVTFTLPGRAAREAARPEGEGRGADAGANGNANANANAAGAAAVGAAVANAATADRDGDTVPDAADLCPDRVGDASAAAKRRGCPADRDGDGLPDVDDRCPDEPGVEGSDPARAGCPADSDGDGVLDPVDACPSEKGDKNADPRLHGCPRAVRLEGAQIVIREEVRFASGRDVIDPQSFDLLQQVAQVMKDHPEIARVAVEGHTDNVGAEKANVALSQRRAVAVVRWLGEHGVDARRLEARGFGPRRPIADNKSNEGRARNRRVEFQILKRTAEGEAGWRDGPLD